MLYIDQPVQVGYSYDVPTNCTVALNRSLNYVVSPSDFSDEVPKQNSTFLVGTLASQNLTYAPNTTVHAAHALWHFAQTFFEEMPVYKPHDEKISIWTESYGGKYGPTFTRFFTEQNEKIKNGTITQPGAHYVHLDTLGIINGCIAFTDQNLAYITFAHNNTYGIQVTNKTIYDRQMHEFEREGGLRDAIQKCQRIAREADPNYRGDVDEVNKYCSEFEDLDVDLIERPYFESQKVNQVTFSLNLLASGSALSLSYQKDAVWSKRWRLTVTYYVLVRLVRHYTSICRSIPTEILYRLSQPALGSASAWGSRQPHLGLGQGGDSISQHWRHDQRRHSRGRCLRSRKWSQGRSCLR